MLTINDSNRVFVNEIVNLFINDHEFQQRVIEELNNDDLCSNMQLGNPEDISYARNVRAIRLCRVVHDLGDNVYSELDYWLCPFDGHYVIAECQADRHYSTCARAVGNLSPLWTIALAA